MGCQFHNAKKYVEPAENTPNQETKRMTASIHVEGLDKSFGPRAALCGIDFTIEAGEMVTLIGPSGSGKSTLLRHLIGLSRADHQSCSQVEVLGRTVQRYGRLLAAGRNQRRRSGYIFQQFNLVGRLSVLSNVLIGCLGAMPRWRSLTGRFNQKERCLLYTSPSPRD